MPIQSATNCTNTELQTSEFKQKFQHRPACKTNLGALSAKAPALQGRCETSTTFHNFQQGCQSAGQGCKKLQPANLPSFNTLARALATCYKTSTTKLPTQFGSLLGQCVPSQNCNPLGKSCTLRPLQDLRASPAKVSTLQASLLPWQGCQTTGLGCKTDLAGLQNCSVRQSSNTARKGCKLCQSEKVAGPAPTLATIQASLPNCRARLQPANLPSTNTLARVLATSCQKPWQSCETAALSVWQSYNTARLPRLKLQPLPTCQSFNAARLPNSLPAKTVQNELLVQAVHTCTPCKNSIFVAQNRAKRAIPPGRI